MATYSTLYQLTKPTVGGDADVWGNGLNTSLDDLDALSGAMTCGGSSSAYTLTTGLSLAAYVSNQRFLVKWNHTNGTTPTLAVDGLAAKNIKKRDASTAPSASDLVSGAFAFVAYDGTNFVLLTPVASDYQPPDATLTALAALSYTSGTLIPTMTAADTFALVSDALYAHLAGTETFSGTKTFSAAVTINLSGGTLTAPPSGTSLHLGGATQNRQVFDAFAASNTFEARRANGTIGSKTASASADIIFALQGYGYGATGYSASARASMRFVASEAYTDSVQGMRGQLHSTPVGSTTLAENYRWGDTTSTLELGYRDGGPGSVPDTTYTYALTDRGTPTDHSSGSAHTYTVPPASSVAWPANSILMGCNTGAGTLTIGRGSGVVIRNAAGTDADLSVPQYAYYVLRRVASDVWYGRTY